MMLDEGRAGVTGAVPNSMEVRCEVVPTLLAMSCAVK